MKVRSATIFGGVAGTLFVTGGFLAWLGTGGKIFEGWGLVVYVFSGMAGGFGALLGAVFAEN